MFFVRCEVYLCVVLLCDVLVLWDCDFCEFGVVAFMFVVCVEVRYVALF